MWGYLIAGIILGIGLTWMVILFHRHYDQIKEMRLSSTAASRFEQKKHAIFEARFNRRVKDASTKIGRRVKPLGDVAGSSVRKGVERLKELEANYRRQRIVQKAVSEPEPLLHELEEVSERGDVGREPVRQAPPIVRTAIEECHDLFDQEEYDIVEERCIEMITADPRDVEAYALLGDVFFAKKDHTNAAASYEHAVKLLIKRKKEMELNQQEKRLLAEASLHASQAHQVLEQPQHALIFAKQAVAIEESNPKYLDAAIEAAIDAGEVVVAYEYLRVLREVNPENKKILNFEERLRG
jgi:tetratricopeptide (TPR) repeat protein